MTPEEQAKTLFTVESTAPFIFHPRNERFRFREEVYFQADEFGSRATTPGRELSTPAPLIKTYLRFTTDNIGQQFTFEFGNERDCDIYLFDPGETQTSRNIFAVELQNGGRCAMLKNLQAPEKLSIESPYYEKLRFRTERVLHPKDKVIIPIEDFTVELLFLHHAGHAALHEAFLRRLAPQFAQAVPGLNQLNLNSIPESSAQGQSQWAHPYCFYEELGSGAFGTVYRAAHSRTGELVAIKKFRRPESRPTALKEAAILQSLDHPNITRFIDFIAPAAGPCLLVMEFISASNLEDAYKECLFYIHEIKDLVIELLHGLNYLHSRRITHRDLKPSNIMVISRSPMKMKMTDFGLATHGSQELRTHCGSLPYLAPEVHQGTYTNKVDIWSVGVIALKLAAGLPGYPRGQDSRWPGLLKERLEAAVLDPHFSSVIRSLLHTLAGDRPSALQSLGAPGLEVEQRYRDAIGNGSPTEYNPTRSEYFQAASALDPGQLEASRSQIRHRSAYAPSPEVPAAQTHIFAPLPSNPFSPKSQGQTQVQAQACARALAPAAPAVPIQAPSYWKLNYAGATVMYRANDGLINMTQLAKAVGRDKPIRWSTLDKKLGGFGRYAVKGRHIIGMYVPMNDALKVLRQLQIPDAAFQELKGQIQAQR